VLPGLIVGALLLTGGLVALLVAISEGRAWGWASPAIVELFVPAVVLLVVCWVVESRLSRPLLDTRLLLAVAHDRQWPVYVGNGVLGFAFASLVNLVVSAVDPRQTGEATGVNTIMRTIGGTFGAQLAATIVTANPGEAGYTTAFTLSAIAMAVAAMVASVSRPRAVAPIG
jgi:hypothetical protein